MPSPPDTSATGPTDWLGYQQYATALWARIVHGFAQESARGGGKPGTEAPAADPLVVGIYGEWGVGKSRLLELVHQHAAAQSAQDCAQRILDPAAYQSTEALRLTIPVWFHPWKYEHEQHLAVPMLMHVADALRARLKEANTLAEKTVEQIEKQGAEMRRSAQEIAAAAKKGAIWVKRIAKVAHGVAGNELVKTATGIAAGFVGMTAVADKSLDWIAKTSEKLVGDDDGEDDDKDEGKDARRPEQAADTRPTHSADGRYYYNVQKYLRELACITPETARAHGLRLRHEIHLNFVVFVDDLDRCLPEKAVEVLEVIKTLLNIEYFAFVVALDDEVIERGISHRYRDYRFEGAKPEMPITGFEYLEKIVHLPFRLPQLTRAQAASFILQQESRMVEPVAGLAGSATPPPRVWYIQPQPGAAASALQPTPLVALLLDSFEAFVPRKLMRTIELMNQYQQVLASRGTPMQIGTGGSSTLIDARIVLFNVLMQLFAPEVFRLIRRRPEMFGQWLRANLPEEPPKSAVFQWRKSTPDDPLVLEVSDADLYRWAALGSEAVAPTPRLDSPADGTRSEWATFLKQPVHSQSDRHSIEQLRLPFAVAICEFRDIQRHAFSPLRLGAAMAFSMGWTYGSVPSLQGYMQLFGDAATLANVPGAMAQVVAAADVATPALPVIRPARTVNIREMLEMIASPDAATRASLVERMGLHKGETVDAAAVGALAATLPSDSPEKAGQLLQALAALGPYLDESVVRKSSWPGLSQWRFDGQTEPVDDVMNAATPCARLHALGLGDALGLQTTIVSARTRLRPMIEHDAPSMDVQQRARAGELLGQLGDPRFDPRNSHLPVERAKVRERPDAPLRDTTSAEEPIIGFVQVPKGTFTMGKKNGSSHQPEHTETIGDDFYIARTLVTVNQFALFMDDGGYADDAWWDAIGAAWKRGDFDSRATDAWVQLTVRQRPPEKRRAPLNWEVQHLNGNVPVSDINWFEARAYARWLDARLRPQIGQHLPNCRVMLPTESQWERAARAAGLDSADIRMYPWGNYSKEIAQRANVESTNLGRACSVGLFEPTLLGLYDMVGNVSVWTDNLFQPVAGPATRLPRDVMFKQSDGPVDGDKDDLVVVRGGSWSTEEESSTCTERWAVPPDTLSGPVGMRMVLCPA